MSLTSSQEDSFHGFSDDGQNMQSGFRKLAMAKEEQDDLKRCLARLERFAENPTPTSKEQVDARLKRLEQCWDQFQKISKEINRLDDMKNKRSNNEQFDDFDERVMVLTGKLKSMRCCAKQESATDSKKPSKETIKLPKIVLPEFLGKFDQWLQFRDMFEQMIHGKAGLLEKQRATCHLVTIEDSLDTLTHCMERFWSIEDVLEGDPYSQLEKDCEDHFAQNVCRDDEGRYVVKLPFNIGEKNLLGKSKENATKRFLQLERRFNRNPSLGHDYAAVIADYVKKSYLQKVEVNDDQQQCYYLPHHPVIKVSSSTTKIRPVFDGSLKTSNNVSLNDILLKGPVI
ncbi:uncharacterized protein LOC128297391 [Anopheles moucheti]|uniref:uncharacterized protein LOC128297391 n=1 Tax=Anopheles moucheti TaxID=186751 RepID=UPI0022F0BEC9|nr:uncharacterized protein LOC128297391 [Anopheles moucheti]